MSSSIFQPARDKVKGMGWGGGGQMGGRAPRCGLFPPTSTGMACGGSHRLISRGSSALGARGDPGASQDPPCRKMARTLRGSSCSLSTWMQGWKRLYLRWMQARTSASGSSVGSSAGRGQGWAGGCCQQPCAPPGGTAQAQALPTPQCRPSPLTIGREARGWPEGDFGDAGDASPGTELRKVLLQEAGALVLLCRQGRLEGGGHKGDPHSPLPPARARVSPVPCSAFLSVLFISSSAATAAFSLVTRSPRRLIVRSWGAPGVGVSTPWHCPAPKPPASLGQGVPVGSLCR